MSDFNFSDWEQKISWLWTTEWVEVFHLWKDHNRLGINCALVTKAKAKWILDRCDWDLLISDHRPGHVFNSKNGKWIWKYYNNTHTWIEPLIRQRRFAIDKYNFPEVSEEFRLFFNLYEKSKWVFSRFTETWEEEDVIVIKVDSVKIKLTALKEYLSARNLHLAIFFEETRFHEAKIEDLWIKPFDENIHKWATYTYKWWWWNNDFHIENTKSFTRILWKKLISWWKDYKPDMWIGEDRKWIEFIIDLDSEWKPIYGNSIGKFGDYLTPVTFRKTVLNKYYNEPTKYTVGDGFVSCEWAWHLSIDNDMEDYISVFLWDLWRDLPEEEVKYWKSFNVATKWKMSETCFGRSIEGEFTDPSMPDLLFKSMFQDFNTRWEKKFWWQLFLTLHQDDKHHLKTLRVPATNDHSEFDAQVLSLTKIIIDSLNEAEISKSITLIDWDKWLDKFNKFLIANWLNISQLITDLKDLQALRSTWSAHRKWWKFESTRKKFGIWEEWIELKKVFFKILQNAIRMLRTLDKNFLT